LRQTLGDHNSGSCLAGSRTAATACATGTMRRQASRPTDLAGRTKPPRQLASVTSPAGTVGGPRLRAHTDSSPIWCGRMARRGVAYWSPRPATAGGDAIELQLPPVSLTAFARTPSTTGSARPVQQRDRHETVGREFRTGMARTTARSRGPRSLVPREGVGAIRISPACWHFRCMAVSVGVPYCRRGAGWRAVMDLSRLGGTELYWRDREGVETAAIGAAVDLAGRRVMDVGCGTGRLTSFAAARAASVYAFDPNGEAVAEARAAVPRELRRRVRFAAHSAEALDVRRRRFDLALCGWSL
jgi:2-polyprenyl-3-methyl-5-hydroxy-6-metoxy-1,4-benzoquinol methylase